MKEGKTCVLWIKECDKVLETYLQKVSFIESTYERL